MTALEYLFAYPLTVYQSGYNNAEFLKACIVKFDSVREIYSIIKFTFESFPLASSSVRQLVLPLPILPSLFLREIRGDDLRIFAYKLPLKPSPAV